MMQSLKRAGYVSVVVGIFITVLAVILYLLVRHPSGATGASTRAKTASVASPLTAQQIETFRGLAVKAAAENGDANPTNMQLVVTTRNTANLVANGADIPSQVPSVEIAMDGKFVASGAPVPAGAAAPTGSVLTLVIDLTTNQIMDYTIGNTQPNLASIGTVQNLVP